MTSKKTSVLEAALRYNSRGWTVVPVCPAKGCASPNCSEGLRGKHPLINGYTKLTRIATKTIEKWFANRPDAGVGIVCGEYSGLVVVDLDGAAGEESLKKLERQHGPLPDTLTAISGRVGGGRHIYFRHPGGKVANTVAIAPGIDVRADGSFVVAPPSVHRSGNAYKWVDETAKIADCPDWLIQLANAKKAKLPVEPAVQPVPSTDGLILRKGNRTNWLFKRGCSLRGQGQQEPEIESALIELNGRYCQPPLPENKVQAIAMSVCSQYPAGDAKPRSHAQRKEENPLWYWMLNTAKYRAETYALDSEQRGWHISLSIEAWDCQGVIDGNPDKVWKNRPRCEQRNL